LYVCNFGDKLSEYALIKLFQPFGTIVREHYLWHRDEGPSMGKPKGFAFVEFKTRAQSEQAKAALNGWKFEGGGGKELVVRFSEARDAGDGLNIATAAPLLDLKTFDMSRQPGGGKASMAAVDPQIKILAIELKLREMDAQAAKRYKIDDDATTSSSSSSSSASANVSQLLQLRSSSAAASSSAATASSSF
jgi:RNA recognition motif-containing protein